MSGIMDDSINLYPKLYNPEIGNKRKLLINVSEDDYTDKKKLLE